MEGNGQDGWKALFAGYGPDYKARGHFLRARQGILSIRIFHNMKSYVII
jgi:hypothetical protein